MESCCEHGDEPCGFIKFREFFDWVSNCKFVKNDCIICSSLNQTASSGAPNCTAVNVGLMADRKTIDRNNNEGVACGPQDEPYNLWLGAELLIDLGVRRGESQPL